MTYCPQCDAKIDESMSFCEACGKELDWAQQLPSQAEPSEQAPEQHDDESIQHAQRDEASDEEPPVVSPTKLKPKKERKPIDIKKLVMASTIGVLLISIATIFTLSWMALPSAQKWLDQTNEAFLQGDVEAFYNAFSKPAPMISNAETFYAEMASEWPTITQKLQQDIDKGKSYATFQNSEGRDLLEMRVVKKWGMTDVTMRYFPVEVTLVASKKHQTITLQDIELFSIHDNETFTLYAVPGSYPLEITHKGTTENRMIILQSNEAHKHVLGDAS